MKRYIDITRKLKGNNLKDMGLLGKWVEIEDLPALPYNLLSMSYMYVPGEVSKTSGLASVFTGRFFSRGWKVSLNKVVSGEVLTCDILGEIEDSIQRGDSLIIDTGWGDKAFGSEYYFYKNPSLGLDLIEWALRKQLNMIITDTPLLANSIYLPEFTEIYQKLAEGNILVVAGATNLSLLGDAPLEVIVTPLSIDKANFSPVRGVAVLMA